MRKLYCRLFGHEYEHGSMRAKRSREWTVTSIGGATLFHCRRCDSRWFGGKWCREKPPTRRDIFLPYSGITIQGEH